MYKSYIALQLVLTQQHRRLPCELLLFCAYLDRQDTGL
jgi:hypothetical protein